MNYKIQQDDAARGRGVKDNDALWMEKIQIYMYNFMRREYKSPAGIQPLLSRGSGGTFRTVARTTDVKYFATREPPKGSLEGW